MSQSNQIELEEVPLFAGLSPSQIKILGNSLKEKLFQKDEILFFDGKPCDKILIIRSGKVKVFRTASSGREQILEILNPGDTCACNPGTSTWCCSSTSQALTDCSVWVIPRIKYTLMVKTNSQMVHSLNLLFANRLKKFNSLIEEVSLDKPKMRIAKFILDLANNDSNEGIADPAALSFTHEQIASRLGLVRETVTRHLQQLKRAGLIDIKPRQIILLNRKALEQLV